MEGSSKNSADDGKQVYPLRQRISEADALKNIQQWMESNEDDLLIESELGNKQRRRRNRG